MFSDLEQRFSYALGIDLSNSNIGMAVFHAKKGCEILPISKGKYSMPSYISFTDDGVLFGEDAKNQLISNPTNTIYDFLHLISDKYSDPEYQHRLKSYPFKIVKDSHDKPQIEVTFKGEIKRFYLKEILGMIFQHLKEIATSYLTSSKKYKKVLHAKVILNSDSHRETIHDALVLAGFNPFYPVKRSIALSCGLGLQELRNETNAVVISCGSNSFDLWIYQICGMFETRAEQSCKTLGGNNFDERLSDYFAGRFNEQYKCNIYESPESIGVLRSACENVKIQLTTNENASIFCPSIYEGHDLKDEISRSTFECICDDMFNGMITNIENALEKAEMKKEDISYVILFGGTSKIKRIQKIIQNFFNNLEVKICENASELALLGAARQAYYYKLNYQEIEVYVLIIDSLILSFGIETSDGNTKFFLSNKNGYYRNKSFLFTTSKDNQTKVAINVFEGKRLKSKNNRLIGKFEFDGIEPQPKGVPQIEVTMKSACFGNGNFIKIKVMDKKTGKYECFIIEYAKIKLDEDVINYIISDSKNHELKEEETQNEIDKKFELQNFCFNVKNWIENGSCQKLISKSEKDAVNKEINDVLDWIDSNKNESISNFEIKRKEIKNKLDPILQRMNANIALENLQFVGCLPDVID